MTMADWTNTRRAADWFAGRTLRERIILGVAGVAFVALVFVGLIWRPLNLARAAAIERVDQQDALIAIMRTDGDRLRAISATAPPSSTVPTATAITQEAATRQIAIQRLEREGTHLRVTLDNADFPALIAWLNRLETAHGLRLVDLELERRPTPGVVSARVTLEE